MYNFWTTLKEPFFALAPLSGVTDSAFRRICKGLGADVVYSELASSTALSYNPEVSIRILRFDESERPYVVQLFGSNPQHFAAAARLVTEEIRPDGIDINFGCPIPKVFNSGAGAALMTNLPLAKEVIRSVIDNTDLPVSIKTRTSVKGVDLPSFLDHIADLDIKAVMVHGRSYSQRFSGPNDIETTRAVRRSFRGVVLANGGVNTAAQGLQLLKETGAGGLGVARGALGNPWIFQQLKAASIGIANGKPSSEDVFKTALEHAKFVSDLKGKRGIIQMRKHLCWYLQQVPGTKKLREMAVRISTVEDVAELLAQTGRADPTAPPK
jgi:nifR3 family TIM-barrel protein